VRLADGAEHWTMPTGHGYTTSRPVVGPIVEDPPEDVPEREPPDWPD
jgi:hypothetical protein